MVERKAYLAELEKWRDEKVIKVVTGLRRCGKSTLLSIMAGLEEPTSGSILLDDDDLEMSREKIGLMPQRDQLFEWRTIWKNVLLGPEIRREITAERQTQVGALLDQYALGMFRRRQPSAAISRW